MHVSGVIISVHANAENVAQALSPDNGGYMSVAAVSGCVVAKIEGESLRSVIATVDDYLVNLSVSERLS